MDQLQTELIRHAHAAAVPELVASNDIVLLIWMAPGCAACDAAHADILQTAREYPDVLFVRIYPDVAGRDLSAELGIDEWPAISIFRDRVLLYSRSGAVSRAALEDLVRQARTLDMTWVHAVMSETERERAARS